MSASVGNKAVLEGGDLGLGRGWKPGAIPKEDSSSDDDFQLASIMVHSLDGGDDDSSDVPPMPPHVTDTGLGIRNLRHSIDVVDEIRTSQNDAETQELNKDNCPSSSDNLPKSRRKLSHKLRLLRKANSECMDMHSARSEESLPSSPDFHSKQKDLNGDLKGEFPVYADVPIGTSIRQQKQLFQEEMNELYAQHGADISESNINGLSKSKGGLKILDKNLLQTKLFKTQQEVDALKLDLEQCQMQLLAKYKAINILQHQLSFSEESQASEARVEQKKTTRKSSAVKHQLQQEINKLRFEMEYKQSTLMDSQQTWAERYDRACQENAALMATHEARSEETRKLLAEKMAVSRERDELLALLDIQERERYESLRMSQSHEGEDVAYSDYSAPELAILGACQCRVKAPDPCGCAHAAVHLKRQIVQLNEQIVEQKNRWKESIITADSYRIAFEEQLSRNRALVQQLAQMTAASMNHGSKSDKFKATIKWLIQQLNEDIPPRPLPRPVGEDTPGDTSWGTPRDTLEDKSERELILLLVDLVSDKNEALAHQKLASRMLADRARELEAKLAAATEDVFHK